MARLLSGASGAADQALASQIKVVFPTPAHGNVAGAGVPRASKQPAAAARWMEVLAPAVAGLDHSSSRLRSIQAVFSCTCSRWVSRSAVG
jgi:iron(III) transport system substrate-binding protein